MEDGRKGFAVWIRNASRVLLVSRGRKEVWRSSLGRQRAPQSNTKSRRLLVCRTMGNQEILINHILSHHSLGHHGGCVHDSEAQPDDLCALDGNLDGPCLNAGRCISLRHAVVLAGGCSGRNGHFPPWARFSSLGTQYLLLVLDIRTA